MSKKILDACCSSKMFWFDKNNPFAVFMDIRKEEIVCCDGRSIKVDPDVIGDFTKMPFENESFKLVIFDPPHDMYAGKKSFIAQKYGNLNKDTWKEDLKKGFDESMRVLEPNGILVFKWNEIRVTVKQILEIVGTDPLIGHKSGKANKTHWLLFMKH